MRLLNMKPHKEKELLITFCGLDGCGKSTMIRMLREELERCGKRVFVTKQPTDTMRQTSIFRAYMDSEDHSKYEYRTLSLMAAADRVQHSNQVILSAMEQGCTVISDRYFYSCLANLYARGYENDEWIYEIARDIPRPDYAFFLDVSVDTAVSRVRSRSEEKNRYIDMDLQYRLRDEYRNICKENDGILLSSDHSPEETFAYVWMHLEHEFGGENYE